MQYKSCILRYIKSEKRHLPMRMPRNPKDSGRKKKDLNSNRGIWFDRFKWPLFLVKHV